MDNAQPIIDGIHECLTEKQGLVEAVVGKTQYNKLISYSIVKSARETSGMIYILTMHFKKNGKALCLKGHFEEHGVTGVRDNTVYEYAMRKKLIKEDTKEGWFKDPYDAKYTRGIRMNLSESRQFDSRFPEHPLSQLRKLIYYIIENN